MNSITKNRFRDGYICKVLAVPGWKSEFEFQYVHTKSRVVLYTCNDIAEEEETDRLKY